jgi:hypothetical protein
MAFDRRQCRRGPGDLSFAPEAAGAPPFDAMIAVALSRMRDLLLPG